MKKQELNLDKSAWTTVKFGDVVFEPKESSKDPVADGIDKVVGLEHIESENIHLRNFASIEEGTTFTKRFSEGDVLFGRRRAYLKKVALASFEGICSGDITVFRAKVDVILPSLLPFVVQNEKFYDYAIKHSAGGLSPRVKFKDLANYEFLLPPKDQQAQLAELLWSMDEVVEREKEVLGKLNTTILSNRKYFIERGVTQVEDSKRLRFGKICWTWEIAKISDVCKIISGNAFKSSNFKQDGQFQVLRIGNITYDGFNVNKAPVFISEISQKESSYLIPKGAIVLSLTGTNGKRDYGYPSFMFDHKKYLLNQRLVMLISNSSVLLPEFLHLVSKMEFFQSCFFLNATGTANQANVSTMDVAEIEIPIPPLKEQSHIIRKVASIRNSISDGKCKIEKSKALQKSLINQIF